MKTMFQHLEMADRQRGNLRVIWEMVVTEERNRLAREIHDTPVQSFAGIVLHSEALETALGMNNSRSQRAHLTIQKLARSGLDEARRSVQALRPKMLKAGHLPKHSKKRSARILVLCSQSISNKPRRKRRLPFSLHDVSFSSAVLAQQRWPACR